MSLQILCKLLLICIGHYFAIKYTGIDITIKIYCKGFFHESLLGMILLYWKLFYNRNELNNYFPF